MAWTSVLETVAQDVRYGLPRIAAIAALEGLLVGPTSLDPATFVTSAVLFSLVAAAACAIPAWRATRIDPAVALRSE